MGIPQIIIMVSYSIVLGANILQHGKTIENKHNFWVVLISKIILFTILKYGGFFNEMKTPQITTIILNSLIIGREMLQHGKVTEEKHDLRIDITNMVISLVLLKCGRFF